MIRWIAFRLNYWFGALGRRVAQIIGLILLAVFVGLVATYYVLKPSVPESADLWKINRTPALTFKDSTDEVIGSRGGLHTKPVRLTEFPEHLRLSFLTAEDRRFYDHGAIDWWGVLRALFVNIKQGQIVQGGSTITQQLAKNIFLTNERTLARKVKELILARELEKLLTKDDILELYLNRIYLGAGAYGVEAAAQTYFAKSARDVTIAEAAMLAGLAKAPSRYAPSSNIELAQERAGIVLKTLHDEDVITDLQYILALNNPASVFNRSISGDINYFLDYVTWEVDKYVTSPDVDLVVYTTLDRYLQTKGEAAVKAIIDDEAKARLVGQAALVSLDTNGAVRAMVGGLSYRESQFNRAAQAHRQPGSSFKPFVYLTALEQGMKPTKVYQDAPVRIGDWQPQNYSNYYRGRVTITEALQYSINTVAVRVSQDVGMENIVATAHRLGITSELKANRSLALGTSEVTLLEMTAAYVPFAKRGLSADQYAITRIETENGDVIYQRVAPQVVRLFSRRVADDIGHMLYQVMYQGTGKAAALADRPAAGKTGTSSDWRDAWFLGYTPDLVTGVWLGNDDNSPMDHVTGGGLPAKIWHHYMTAAHEGMAIAQLPGAFPARDVATDKELRDYLADLSRQFKRVKRRPKGRRRSSGFWPF